MRDKLLEARRAILIQLERLRTERAGFVAQLEEINKELAAHTGAKPKQRTGRPKSDARLRFEATLKALAVGECVDISKCLVTAAQAMSSIRELEDLDESLGFDVHEVTKIVTRVT